MKKSVDWNTLGNKSSFCGCLVGIVALIVTVVGVVLAIPRVQHLLHFDSPDTTTSIVAPSGTANSTSIAATSTPQPQATQPPSYRLFPGQSLKPGQQLMSKNGIYTLLMQDNGTLVEYENGQAVWTFPLHGPPGSYLSVQNDDNIILFRPDGTPGDDLSTQGHPLVTLEVGDDGNVVVYENGHNAIRSLRF